MDPIFVFLIEHRASSDLKPSSLHCFTLGAGPTRRLHCSKLTLSAITWLLSRWKPQRRQHVKSKLSHVSWEWAYKEVVLFSCPVWLTGSLLIYVSWLYSAGSICLSFTCFGKVHSRKVGLIWPRKRKRRLSATQTFPSVMAEAPHGSEHAAGHLADSVHHTAGRCLSLRLFPVLHLKAPLESEHAVKCPTETVRHEWGASDAFSDGVTTRSSSSSRPLLTSSSLWDDLRLILADLKNLMPRNP